MKRNCKAIPSLIFILLATICTIISFSSYWYQSRILLNGFEVTTFFKYNQAYEIFQLNGITDDGFSGRKPYSQRYIQGYSDRLNIFKSSLAFCILAFIILVFSTIFYLIIAIGSMEKLPIVIRDIIQQISKFIVIGATICSLLSMFIFLGIGPASEKDCLKYPYCSDDQFHFIWVSGREYQCPSTGWITIVFASLFCIIASILNFVRYNSIFTITNQ